ncbi:MAG: ribosome silencing factor [Ruminococcaceae bacterium]|nr:ribosome silencing factor [Oscillospiraceae bacterium]
MTAKEKMELAVRHLDNKKAKDIKVLEVTGLTLLADYFVICSATSTTQVKALGDTLEETLELVGEPLLKKEGKQGLNWVLMDYSDVIVHIFYQEIREFYGLEKLWADARELPLNEIIEEE